MCVFIDIKRIVYIMFLNKNLVKRYEMAQDLLYFTENPYYKKIIYNGPLSFSFARSIFAIIIFSFDLGFLFYRCPNQENLIHNANQNVGYIAVFLILSSAYNCYHYVPPWINKLKASSWEKITAEILKINIIRIRVARRYGSTVEYFPVIEYRYEVDNKKYKSNRFSFESDYNYNFSLDPGTSNKYHPINKKFSKWIEEKKVEIYYNPKNPMQSVVIKDFHPLRNLFYIVFGIISISTFIVSIFNFACWAYWTF